MSDDVQSHSRIQSATLQPRAISRLESFDGVALKCAISFAGTKICSSYMVYRCHVHEILVGRSWSDAA
jgi:hypothetical protein